MGTVSLKRLQKNVSPFSSHCLFWNPRVKTWMRFFISLMAMCAVLRAAEQPNILWITAEDMSATLVCYGDKYATTPNIDRLAKESVRYTKAFASAPVCSPSRSCLITGCYPTSLSTQQMRSGFAIPNEMRGFPALLRARGFYTSNNVKTDYNTGNYADIIKHSWNESSATAHWRNRPDKAQIAEQKKAFPNCRITNNATK